MEKIVLKHVLPAVFQEQRAVLQSDVWLQELSLQRGEKVLIEAESGTGKSSLCSYIFGYRKDFSGEILFDGQDINTLKTGQWVELRKQSLSMLWQDLRLFPELTAWENVQIKNNLTHFQEEKQLHAWFEQLGIADKEQALIGRMSFGQQQRVALIRALCQPFHFIFVDEPVSHLDERNAQVLGDILSQEVARQGAGLVVTSIGKHMLLDYQKVLKL